MVNETRELKEIEITPVNCKTKVFKTKAEFRFKGIDGKLVTIILEKNQIKIIKQIVEKTLRSIEDTEYRIVG